MNTNNLISTQILCSHYDIEISFVDQLSKMGLIQIEVVEQNLYIHQDQISNFEKIVRLYYELDVNLEGIDIVFNLLEKERELQTELIALKNKLRLYENF